MKSDRRTSKLKDAATTRALSKSADEQQTVSNHACESVSGPTTSTPRTPSESVDKENRCKSGKSKVKEHLIGFEDACKHLHTFGIYDPCLLSCSRRSRNMAYSPLATKVVLSIVLDGATNAARHEILTALDLSNASHVAIAAAKEKMSHKVHTYGSSKDGLDSVKLWNGVYVHGLLKVKAHYFEAVESQYLCCNTPLDFEHNTPKDVVMILNSGPTQACGVVDCFHISDISPSSNVVFGSAVHIKTVWKYKFTVKKESFTLMDGSTKEISHMTTHASFNTFAMSQVNAKAVEIPFAGGRVCMVVILPDSPSEFKNLESLLRDPSEDILKYAEEMKCEPLKFTIPKVTISTRINIRNALQLIGMRSVFRTDLSNMLEDTDCGVSVMVQKTVLEIDPDGEHASMEQPQSNVFACNRPFVFFIKDVKSSTFLLCGRVVDP